MSDYAALRPAQIGHSMPRKICATALAFMPSIGWAASASAQPVQAGLSVLAAPSSAQSVSNEADSISAAPAPSTEQAPPATEPGPAATAPAGSSAALSGNELAKEINNPVTSLWQIQFEFNNYKLESNDLSPVSGKWVHNLYFQPVLPIGLTNNWNLITRPIITAYQSVPHPTPPIGRVKRTTAFGDMVLAQVLSPAHTEPWIIAAGPTWIFPTSGSKYVGQGKFQVGPAVGGGYITNKFMIAAFAQQWWSFAGDSHRKETSQMNLLPLVNLFWGDGWSAGYSGNIVADWKADHGNRWTVPAGLALGKVVKVGILPVQFKVGGQYMAIRPDFGPKWNFQLQITPVIPRMIKKPIFE